MLLRLDLSNYKLRTEHCCKTDYLGMDIVNGDITIDSSSELPLRYRSGDRDETYETKGSLVLAIQELASNGSTSCS